MAMKVAKKLVKATIKEHYDTISAIDVWTLMGHLETIEWQGELGCWKMFCITAKIPLTILFAGYVVVKTAVQAVQNNILPLLYIYTMVTLAMWCYNNRRCLTAGPKVLREKMGSYWKVLGLWKRVAMERQRFSEQATPYFDDVKDRMDEHFQTLCRWLDADHVRVELRLDKTDKTLFEHLHLITEVKTAISGISAGTAALQSLHTRFERLEKEVTGARTMLHALSTQVAEIKSKANTTHELEARILEDGKELKKDISFTGDRVEIGLSILNDLRSLGNKSNRGQPSQRANPGTPAITSFTQTAVTAQNTQGKGLQRDMRHRPGSESAGQA
jgi:hypothetical protein